MEEFREEAKEFVIKIFLGVIITIIICSIRDYFYEKKEKLENLEKNCINNGCVCYCHQK